MEMALDELPSIQPFIEADCHRYRLFHKIALDEFLDENPSIAAHRNTLYACLDKSLRHLPSRLENLYEGSFGGSLSRSGELRQQFFLKLYQGRVDGAEELGVTGDTLSHWQYDYSTAYALELLGGPAQIRIWGQEHSSCIDEDLDYLEYSEDARERRTKIDLLHVYDLIVQLDVGYFTQLHEQVYMKQ